ncbi:MAG: fluoride efflux transporter CrcB [Candidatus Omnitrophota bacterium]|jgi:CrcB protein
MSKWISLAAGGILGTFARYFLSGTIHRLFGVTFPLGTLVVNLVGCFAIGFLAVLAEEKFLLGPTARVFLMIGFCGAFTTFSSFILETSNLTKDGESLYAFMNIALSVVLGFLVFRLGVMLARAV